MITWGRLLMSVLLLWIAIHTASYGTWTWKNKNRFGAVMVFLIAIITLALPVYIAFFIR